MSPGDLRRLAVTQTPVEDYQLTLVGKTLKGIIIIIIIIMIIIIIIIKIVKYQDLARELKNYGT